MPDDPILQAMWNEIRRLTETQQGGAVLAHEIREKVMKVAGLNNKLTGDEGALFKARMMVTQRLMNMLGIIVIGDGEEYTSRNNPATGFKDLSETAWDALSTAVGWPKVVLRGDAPSGLNTDGASAWQSFHQTVGDFQERNRSRLNRLYTVIYNSQDGPTGGRVPPEWAITFHPLDEPSQKEVAEVRKLVAEPLYELRQQVADELLRRTAEKNEVVPLDRDPVPEQFSEQVRRYYERLGSGR